MTTLLYERGAAEGAGSGGGASLEDRMQALIALAKRTPRNGGPAWDDAVHPRPRRCSSRSASRACARAPAARASRR